MNGKFVIVPVVDCKIDGFTHRYAGGSALQIVLRSGELCRQKGHRIGALDALLLEISRASTPYFGRGHKRIEGVKNKTAALKVADKLSLDDEKRPLSNPFRMKEVARSSLNEYC